ncbi:MAG: methylmalonyl-CoA mutase family protein, partial [Gammaproteobacteria bacterium]|nr:methylmalonyl-CoA mutase family protein [Gammaproteobacteria bacterium]
KIQDESLYYESMKHDGSLPLIGVNTFLGVDNEPQAKAAKQLIRSTEEEKQAQVKNTAEFLERNAQRLEAALEQLQAAAANGGNVFASLMETVKISSLGRISQALYRVGGQYRRSM